MKNLKFFLSILFLGLGLNGFGQLSFPNGRVLDTSTHEVLMYYETQLVFQTGKNKPDQYRYEKISENLFPGWLVTACFNGDCRNELEESGNFLSIYGYNDSTCFIAFHMYTHEIKGFSEIKYRVINTKDSTDKADLTVKATYLGNLPVNTINMVNEKTGIFPNPIYGSQKSVSVKGLKNGDYQIVLFDMMGKVLIKNEAQKVVDGNFDLDFSQFQIGPGIYFLKIGGPSGMETFKIQVL